MKMAEVTPTRSGFHADPEAGVCYRTLDFMGACGYRVGDDGSVWSCRKQLGPGHFGGAKWAIGKSWRKLRPTKATKESGRQEYVITLMTPEGRKVRKVHRIVLLAFAGPCPPGQESCHGDGDSLNNSLGNLRWDTKKGNAADRVRHGTDPEGERNPAAILTESDVREIRKECASGAKRRDVAKHRGVSLATIYHIVSRRIWKHVA
jgi:hypothetical protein